MSSKEQRASGTLATNPTISVAPGRCWVGAQDAVRAGAGADRRVVVGADETVSFGSFGFWIFSFKFRWIPAVPRQTDPPLLTERRGFATFRNAGCRGAPALAPFGETASALERA